ncbi:MAG: DnaB-like helicase C-terminal domain-containing protein [Flavobacteriales bacterium]|jgi:replicative DNA helicase|nr:DnaB-like helicase C-terminal domain-containing protein [Flavobacteriales bacterium]
MSDQCFFSGIKMLDNAIGGFRPGELVILAGEPAMGKTSFVLSMMLSKLQKQRIGYISLEESLFKFKERVALASRQIEECSFEMEKNGRSGILRTENVSHPVVYKYWPTLIDLCELVSIMKREKNVDCIVINAMLFVGPKSSQLFKKKRRYLPILKHLKILAELMEIPVILEASTDYRKRSKKSGRYNHYAITEQVADRIITLYRWEYRNQKKDNFGQKVLKGDTTVYIDKSVYPVKSPWMTLVFDENTLLFQDPHD